MRLGELAREAGVSKFAASRAATPLTEMSLLAVDEDGRYEFVTSHPMAETLSDLAWRVSGVIRGNPDQPAGRWHSLVEDDWDYRDLLPPPLRLGVKPLPALSQVQGPCLVDIRDFITGLQPLFDDLNDYWTVAQEVYSRWHNERLRDVIHQATFTGALAAAAATLREVCDSSAQGDGDPWQVCITGHHWVRATYLVSATAVKVCTLLRILLRAVDLGGQVNRRRDEAIMMLEDVNGRPDSEHASSWVARALAAVAEADQLWSAPTPDGERPYHHVGGMPRPVDVGTAGDQILAVQLTNSLQRVTDTVASMANHPSLAAWWAAYPVDWQPGLMTTPVLRSQTPLS